MFAADLKASLIRVAMFGKKGLPAPENSSAAERLEIRRWRLFVPVAITLVCLVVGAWYAGRQSAQLEAQRVSAEVDQLARQIASNRLVLKQQKNKTDQLEKALRASGKTTTLAVQTQLRQQLLKAEAEASEYKAIVDREREAARDNSRLLEALSTPGTRLLSLKGADTAAEATAYALLVANTRLLFVGSNLPQLAEGRQFQLWLVRKQEPKFVSAGVFTASDDNRILISFDDASVLSDLSALLVTQEPQGGSSTPTGTRLLESSTAGESNRSGSAQIHGLAEQVF